MYVRFGAKDLILNPIFKISLIMLIFTIISRIKCIIEKYIIFLCFITPYILVHLAGYEFN